jgi:hypothetical protein
VSVTRKSALTLDDGGNYVTILTLMKALLVQVMDEYGILEIM